MKNIKLLMIASSDKIGLTYHLTDFCVALKEKGLDIVVISDKNEQVEGLKTKLKTAKIKHYEITGIDNRHFFSILSNVFEIMKIIKTEMPTIIHSNGLTHFFRIYIGALFLFRRKMKIVFLLTNHSSTIFDIWWQRLILSIATFLSDGIISLCNSSYENLCSLNLNSNKIFVIPNAINLEKFDHLSLKNCKKLDTKFKNEGYGKKIAYLAMLRPLKGHIYFLQSAKIILKRYKDSIFYVVGDGELYNYLKEYVIKLGISKNVVFTGLLPNYEIPRFLSLIDIGVSSSLAEQFPHSILEIMAAGKPVVATNVGSIPDLVLDGKSGFLVPIRDPDALSEKILYLLDNPKMLIEMGKNGRIIIENKYDINKVCEMTIAVYIELLYRKRCQL